MTKDLQNFLIEFDELESLITRSRSKYSKVNQTNLENILTKEILTIFEKMSKIFKVILLRLKPTAQKPRWGNYQFVGSLRK